MGFTKQLTDNSGIQSDKYFHVDWERTRKTGVLHLDWWHTKTVYDTGNRKIERVRIPVGPEKLDSNGCLVQADVLSDLTETGIAAVYTYLADKKTYFQGQIVDISTCTPVLEV